MGKFIIYTDGACSGNPGIGGWGAIIIDTEGNREEILGSEDYTTNNKMELTAAVKALESIESHSEVTLYTDSQYLKNGITTWIHNWKKNNWYRDQKKKQAVKNKELWEQLDAQQQRLSVNWYWVKAHADNENNNRADFLANSAIQQRRTVLTGQT